MNNSQAVNSPDPYSTSTFWKTLERVGVHVLLLFSIALNCVLIFKVKQYGNSLTQLKAEEALSVGTLVPPITGTTPDGLTAQLRFDSASVPTVLYVFTPQCSWCLKNLPSLHALINHSGPKYRLIGISLTRLGLKDYLTAHNLELPVYTDLSEDVTRQYRLGGTPMTIVVKPDGHVQKIWTGAYQADIQPQIETALSVSLPGCCAK